MAQDRKSVLVERTEVDQAVSLLAHRQVDDDQLYAELCAALAHVLTAVRCGRGDEHWVVAWWEHRGDLDVLHLTPGRGLLDLLLPPAAMPALPPSREGR